MKRREFFKLGAGAGIAALLPFLPKSKPQAIPENHSFTLRNSDAHTAITYTICNYGISDAIPFEAIKDDQYGILGRQYSDVLSSLR